MAESDVKYLRSRLVDGEDVVFAVDGYIGEMMGSGTNKQHNGALILTNCRIAFVSSGWLGVVHEEIALDKVSSLEQRPNGLLKSLVVHTSGNNIHFKAGAKTGEFVDAYHRVRTANAPAASPPSATPPSADPLAQLERLGKLKDAGILTDAEFQAKKAELLSRL